MKIQKNSLVSLKMSLSDENGNLIEGNDEEIIYLHGGYGHLFVKLEEALEGKKVGDKFSVKLSASEAFGEFKEEFIVQVDLEDLEQDVEVGMELDGEVEGVIYSIVRIEDGVALLDGNHPFAGVPMIATGEILEIEALGKEAIAKILEDEHRH